MNALVQGLKVDFDFVIIQNVVCVTSISPLQHEKIDHSSHSVFSYVTISTALPTRLRRSIGSLSLLARHLLVRASMDSRASFPTCALIFRISRSHCLFEAVTASFICPLTDGSEDRRCWKKGVWEREVGGMLWISSRD